MSKNSKGDYKRRYIALVADSVTGGFESCGRVVAMVRNLKEVGYGT